MLSYFPITLLLLYAIHGYSLDIASVNVANDSEVLVKSKLLKNERTVVNGSQLEKEAKGEKGLPEVSPERRKAYLSIADRRAYFKRSDDVARGRRPTSRRVDSDRDFLEPQETVHRPQHAVPQGILPRPQYNKPQETMLRQQHTAPQGTVPRSQNNLPLETVTRPHYTIPKQSVINVDKKFYEFGLKLPKRISTKLSLVDGWGTTALPEDMDNLVMPPRPKYGPKMSRLVTQSSPRPHLPVFPLPLSLSDKTYPTRIESNENNKRILSEMTKEKQQTTTFNPIGYDITKSTTVASIAVNILNQSSSPSSMTVPTTSIDVITTTPRNVQDQETGATTRSNTTPLSSTPDALPTSGSNDNENLLRVDNNNSMTMDFSNMSTAPNSSTNTFHSVPKAAPVSVASVPTNQQPAIVSSTPPFSVIVDGQRTDEHEGRAFPSGFNDFRREDEPEDDVNPLRIELNKTQTIPHRAFNETTALPFTNASTFGTTEEMTSYITTNTTVPTEVFSHQAVEDSAVESSADETIVFSQPKTKAKPLPTSTEPIFSPSYIKVYVTSQPTEETPLNIIYGATDSSNSSDVGIVVSIVDEDSVSVQSVGIAVYLLAVFGLVPLVLAFVFATKFFLNRQSRKSECGSDASSTDAQPSSSRPRGSELRKSPSSATTITLVHAPRLPRVQQKSPSWELPRHQLTLLSILGHGNFGQVWKAELQDNPTSNPKLVAVKTVKEGATDKEQEEIIKELQVMQHAGHHPNVVQLLGCCTEKDPYYLVMEYVAGGKLLTFLREHRTQGNYYNFSSDCEALTSRDLTVFMYCVARGMEYLVSKRIIHRDLAARNVLVDQHKMCKIADFGMSRLTQEGGDGEVYEERQHRGALPIRWMAPESLHYSVFTYKSDVWSFGILMWEIVTLGSTPYPRLGAREVVQGVRAGLRLQRPGHVKTDLFRLVSRCWAQEPQARPTFTELRLHLADLLDGSCVDLDSFALDNRFQLQTRTRNRRSRNTGKGTVTLVGNGSFTVNSRILDNQFSIV